jgi:hypothetical protein
LPAERRERFERIFDVQVVEGRCTVPPGMREWVIQRFGSVEAVERQHIVRVTNRVTWEGAIFNPLRARRPMPQHAAQHANPSPDGDIFADPENSTAADVFGRIRGEYCVTTSNIARWDGQCAVLIFDEPDPLAFTRAHLRDYFRTALHWAEAAHQADAQARFLVWMWNGGSAGGASVAHAHAQLGLTRISNYALVEGLRKAALSYQARYRVNYFDDLYAAHDDVGLGFTCSGLRGFVHLAAVRPKDTWLLGDAFDDTLADAVHDVLRAYVDRSDLRGFNVGVVMPPLYEASNGDDWSGFPVIARIVDRGSPNAASSDVGSMDILAQRVIGDDPYATYTALLSQLPS